MVKIAMRAPLRTVRLPPLKNSLGPVWDPSRRHPDIWRGSAQLRAATVPSLSGSCNSTAAGAVHNRDSQGSAGAEPAGPPTSASDVVRGARNTARAFSWVDRARGQEPGMAWSGVVARTPSLACRWGAASSSLLEGRATLSAPPPMTRSVRRLSSSRFVVPLGARSHRLVMREAPLPARRGPFDWALGEHPPGRRLADQRGGRRSEAEDQVSVDQ